MEKYLLGIDIGTGSTKAVAVDFNGVALATAQYYYPVKSPKPGYSEQNPEQILQAFISCVTDVVTQLTQSAYALSFSCAMHSLIPVDADGKALADMITWADGRSEAIAQHLRNSDKGPDIYKTGGTPVHAVSPLCKIMWIRENEPELFAATHKFISIKEYIWHYLFDDYQVDYGIASSTGLFDINNLVWNNEACLLAGITTANLSDPVNTTYKRTGLIPSSAAALTLNTDTIFVIGATDGTCANLGSYITSPDVASLTIGTSGAVRITSPTPVYDFDAMIFNYRLDEKTLVCGGAVNNGGIALNWLLRTFLDKETLSSTDYTAAFARVENIPAGSNGLLFLPYLYGERAPLWDTKTCGVFFNIKPQHTPAHFLRAGLEGICFALSDVVQTIEHPSSAINQLNISGGFITSPVWTQVLADITGKKLVVATQEDASAMGAIFLAMDALNIDSAIRKNAPDEYLTIIPDQSNHQTYNRTFAVFKKLYTQLKDTMHLVYDSGL